MTFMGESHDTFTHEKIRKEETSRLRDSLAPVFPNI